MNKDQTVPLSGTESGTRPAATASESKTNDW